MAVCVMPVNNKYLNDSKKFFSSQQRFRQGMLYNSIVNAMSFACPKMQR